MRGFPRSPPAAGSDQPEPAWQEPRLPDSESTRHFPPAANKNPLSFTSLHLSVCPGHLPGGTKHTGLWELPGCPLSPRGSGSAERRRWHGVGGRAKTAGRAGAPTSTWPLSTAACDPIGWLMRRAVCSQGASVPIAIRAASLGPSGKRAHPAHTRAPRVASRLPRPQAPPEFPEATCSLPH